MRMLTLALISGLASCSKQATPEPKAPSPTTTPPAPLERPTVPAELAVPDDHKLALSVSARGVQIYECIPDANGAPTWKLHAPSAELVDDTGAQIGVHFGGVDKNLPPGPYWESTKDGSRVHAGSPVSAPNQGSIPLLRLQATDATGNGIFSHVSYVHRLATTGGVAPTGDCTAGKRVEVAYTAQYYFYNAP